MIQSLGLAVQGAKPTEERICHRLAAIHLVFPALCWAAASLLGALEGLFSRSFCVLEKAVRCSRGGGGEGRGTTPTRVCSLHVGFIPAENIYREGAMIQKATALLHLRRSLRRSQHNS